jgi:hypothetical protein
MMSDAFADGEPRKETAYYYDLFGFTFAVEEKLPGVSEVPGTETAICIRFGRVPQAIAQPQFQSEFSQVNATEYLISRPGVLRLLAQGDSEIVVERPDGGTGIPFWTLVLCLGASIAGLRHGFIPLHASALEACGGCVALAGQSGFGKSTLAASLVKLGFVLHADDLCLIKPGVAGPLAGAGLREIRLWDDAVETLAWNGGEKAAPLPGLAKTVYRLDGAGAALLPLKRIYVLHYADAETPPGIRRIAGVEALQALIGCLRMRTGLLAPGERQHTFETLASISTATEVFRFVRPYDKAQLAAWSGRLAAHLAS